MAPILCWRQHFLGFAKKRPGIRWHNFSHLHFEAFPEGISQNGCARWIQRLILMKIRPKSCVWWRFCFAETSANFRFFHFFHENVFVFDIVSIYVENFLSSWKFSFLDIMCGSNRWLTIPPPGNGLGHHKSSVPNPGVITGYLFPTLGTITGYLFPTQGLSLDICSRP